MALYQWQNTLEGRGTPLVCLDYLPFARRVYGHDDASWFDAGTLLSTCRQAQQGIKSDVMLFPVLEWVKGWWHSRGIALPQASRPTKALKLALENAALLTALNEVLNALGTLNRADAAIALSLGNVEGWLTWIDPAAAARNSVDESDAEDVCVYLAALSHKLPATAFGSLFLEQTLPIDGDASVAFDPLANAARHFGWALVLCSHDTSRLPEGFGLVACRQPQGAQGLWADATVWSGTSATPAKGAPFVVGTLPADSRPETVLAALSQLRQTEG